MRSANSALIPTAILFSYAFPIDLFPARGSAPKMRSKRLAGVSAKSARAPCLSAGVTILIAIIRRPIGSRAASGTGFHG